MHCSELTASFFAASNGNSVEQMNENAKDCDDSGIVARSGATVKYKHSGGESCCCLAPSVPLGRKRVLAN